MSEIMEHWLEKRANLSPNELAIEMPNHTSITFKQLRDRARTFARKLVTCGVREGDHVALYVNNSVEMVVVIHAISYIGAVAVLINTRLSKTEIAYQLTDARVSMLVTSDQLYEQGTDIETAIPVYCFKDIEQQSAANIDLKQEVSLDDLFTIIYTSGTTGFPKGVKHTYGNHWWSAVSSALNIGLDHDDKWLASLPLFHVGGLSILMKSVIYGMPVYLLEKFDVDVVHKAIVQEGVTMVSVVSILLDRLIERLADGFYPETFRCMLLGGGPAPQVLLQKAKNKGIPVFQTYGMTETSSQIVTLSPTYALDKLGSAGKALFPAQLKIMKEHRVADEFEVGEITVKGPMVTDGYFANEEANEKAFHNDWLSTGDLGYLDDEGFLYVMDRRKDLIISGGENVYPAEIESVLAGIPGVKEAGVVGIEDDTWGQVPVGFVVKTSVDLDEDAILHSCSDQLAKYKIPKQIYFVDALPRNASNKLVRHKLLEWIER
ncbi:o-succinylbenzoate--CoA ligase [Aquibacillus sediminis]|uniref:o-succinylbenzoate--CoA ligase n=1 Tax=Aquibacillus sediminis TaxID=2574734 RepID=UPI001109CD14|nr:o-succinylbenzoate--CoA ligase [Aquibacillus sediminis]